MSKSSGIMKIDSPGKIGPGLNIDQDIIRKQIMAAKQVIIFTVLFWNLLKQVYSKFPSVNPKGSTKV